MISFQVCKNCEHAAYDKGKLNEDGEIIVPPSVLCNASGNMLYMVDEIPEECDYNLEHIMYSDGIPEDIAESLSGYGFEKE